MTLGGTDHNDLLFEVFDALKEISPSVISKVIYVISNASGYVGRFEKLVAMDARSELLVDVACLSEVWDLCDVAVTAGGNTLFERIAAGVPGMTITQLERQEEIATKFDLLGLNRHIGFGPALSGNDISKRLLNFLSDSAAQISQNRNAAELYKESPLNLIYSKIMEKHNDQY